MEPKEGELYRLEDGASWCRNGIILIQRNGAHGLVAVDTYWGGAPNNGALEKNWYTIDDALKARLTFILDLTAARESHQDEYEVYADEDRAFIPKVGGAARWYVHKDAKPNYPRQVDRFERLVREAHGKIEYWIGRENRLVEELKALRDSVVHRPGVMGPCRPDCGICADAVAAKP